MTMIFGIRDLAIMSFRTGCVSACQNSQVIFLRFSSGLALARGGRRPVRIISGYRLALKGFNLPYGALRFRRMLRRSQIVYRLQVQPELCGAAEVAREP